MPVQIGATAHGFSDPTGLLTDCHRRIEMFLASLERAGALLDKPLQPDTRTALESALRYFRDAAPKHTADEEDSLFPRLRRLSHPEVEAAIQQLEPLERDHERANTFHAEVEQLGHRCLQQGRLSSEEAARFRDLVSQLASIYREHIRIEDEVVFPIALRLLSSTDKSAIATEMASRRR
jgi:hemerythrin-like domain-containing protein